MNHKNAAEIAKALRHLADLVGDTVRSPQPLPFDALLRAVHIPPPPPPPRKTPLELAREVVETIPEKRCTAAYALFDAGYTPTVVGATMQFTGTQVRALAQVWAGRKTPEVKLQEAIDAQRGPAEAVSSQETAEAVRVMPSRPRGGRPVTPGSRRQVALAMFEAGKSRKDVIDRLGSDKLEAMYRSQWKQGARPAKVG